MQFLPMDDCLMLEGTPFLILRHGNDAADFLIQQVQVFEGQMYPDAMEFAVDWDDRITDAVGWMPIAYTHPPLTIEHDKEKEPKADAK